MKAIQRLGIAGLGTVGVGVIKTIDKNSDLITKRAGKRLLISAVCARRRHKDRGVDISNFAWENDPIALAKRTDIDVFVELIGGTEQIIQTAYHTAIAHGKHIVTANKALLAMHGQELALAAEARGVGIYFEAAVGGGIPIVKVLHQSFAGNKINRIIGVMNGTCNYILTHMQNSGLSYQKIFTKAKKLGYLEADPQLDVGGIDTAHKLALLSTLAYGTEVDFANVDVQGIENISITDIKHAADIGYRIKLLGISEMTNAGLSQITRPSLVSAQSPLGRLEGSTNMIIVEGDAAGQVALYGPGAGQSATASAVIGDIIDNTRGLKSTVFGIKATALDKAHPARQNNKSSYYIRLMVEDKAGVMATITKKLAHAGLSIKTIQQKNSNTATACILIITHPNNADALKKATTTIKDISTIVQSPVVLRIETM